jgi:hypothetical protein
MGETCDMAPLALSVLIVKGWSVRIGEGRRGSGEEEEEEEEQTEEDERLVLRE